MTERGKSCEIFVANNLKKHNVYFNRFYDSRSFGRVGTSQPADFWIWYEKNLIFIECKEIKSDKKNLPFKAITSSQYKAINAVNKQDIGYFFVLLYQNTVWIINGFKMVNYVAKKWKNQSSMPEKDIFTHFKPFNKKDNLAKHILQDINLYKG